MRCEWFIRFDDLRVIAPTEVRSKNPKFKRKARPRVEGRAPRRVTCDFELWDGMWALVCFESGMIRPKMGFVLHSQRMVTLFVVC